MLTVYTALPCEYNNDLKTVNIGTHTVVSQTNLPCFTFSKAWHNIPWISFLTDSSPALPNTSCLLSNPLNWQVCDINIHSLLARTDFIYRYNDGWSHSMTMIAPENCKWLLLNWFTTNQKSIASCESWSAEHTQCSISLSKGRNLSAIMHSSIYSLTNWGMATQQMDDGYGAMVHCTSLGYHLNK